MKLNLRSVALALGALGLGLGLAFGIGVAYGRGDPKEVEVGLTTQDLQSYLGIGGAGANAGGGTANAGGGRPAGGGRGGVATLLGAGSVGGQITAVGAESVTIEAAAGSRELKLAPSTSIRTLGSGPSAALEVGMTVLASGSENEDGSFAAAAISELPAELGALFAGQAGGGQGGGARGGPAPP